MPEINAIICVPNLGLLETAAKHGLPSTNVERSAGSHELVLETVNWIKLNQNVRCFVLKNYCVVAMGTTMAEAGKQIAAIQTRAKSNVPPKIGKKKVLK
jgi:hypothetical protein